PKHPKVNAVNLKPLTSFLEQPSLPRKGGILGTDPFEPNVAKAFIASRIFLGDAPGYLYVVFGKSGNRMGVPLAYRPWYYPWVAIISGIILVVGLFYILLFRRPVRMILTALKQITAGKLNERVPICGGNELAEIGENINQMADTIEATVSELRRTDRLQREMTAALCHDFGTPLFGAQAYLDQVINGRTWLSAAEQEERLSVAARNLTKLRELVSSFFELSKLDSRNLTPALEPFSVLDLVTEELVPKLKPLAESKHVTLRTEYDDGLPRVVGDMALIDRALTNLIINAINYNRPGGEVVIALNKKNGKVQLEVRDDGIGMKAEDIPFVFDRFFRSDQSRSTITGGSGLGLAIVKKILEAHDEEISVESLIDKGSKFTFSLKSYSAAGN
ncbi:MAG TPA: HAMP domain-containing sensor histidine kinase, partial [Oligoflexia bacterium]|nr:HAMP domain-containing sensor histidine kinase [Oligoflexia bacterium]